MYKLSVYLTIILGLIAICSAGGFLPSGQKIIGYWGCKPGGLPTTTDQLQTALTKGYNVIIYAFYLVDANGGLRVDDGSVPPPTKAEIQAGTTRQFSYLISLFGGQNGAAPTLTLSADAWAQNMYNNFVALNSRYGFDGIDIDLENSWGSTENVVACGLRTFFKLMHNNGFVVSMAPQTTAVWSSDVIPYSKGSWNSYVPLLDSSIINYVDIVAIQLYNNPVPFNDAGKYTESLINGFQVSGCPTCDGSVTGFVKIPASKLAHGWPSTNGAAPAGCSTPAGGCPYGSALSALYAASSSLRSTAGVMTWAIEWDQHGSWSFINSVASISFLGAPATAATTKPVTAAPVTAAPVTAAPVTAAPVTAAPVTAAPVTARPVTAAPVTAAPVTAAPVTAAPVTARPTAAPVTAAPVTAAPVTARPVTAAPAPTQRPPIAPITTKCNLVWSQTPSSSWTNGDGQTVTQFSVTVTVTNGSAKNVQFTMSPASAVTSAWSVVKNLNNGQYMLAQWMYNADGVLPTGSSNSFGYIINSATPATFSLVGDPCQ